MTAPFPDWICVHCDTPLQRTPVNQVVFKWNNTPHCQGCSNCETPKICDKKLTKKGKRFLKNRAKSVKESSLKRGDHCTTPLQTCDTCKKPDLSVTKNWRTWKNQCKNCIKDKDRI